MIHELAGARISKKIFPYVLIFTRSIPLHTYMKELINSAQEVTNIENYRILSSYLWSPFNPSILLDRIGTLKT